MNSRVVVTGMGIACPLGVGVDYVWNKLLSGACGIISVKKLWKRFEEVPCQVAAFIPHGPDPGMLNLKPKFSSTELNHLSKSTVFAIVAADEALENASWERHSCSDSDCENTGVAVGMGMVDLSEILTNGNLLLEKKYSKISPFFVTKILANMAAGNISIRHGFQGPNHAVSTACTTGVHAIGDAFNFIRNGDAKVMVCGGTEAVVTPLSIAGFSRMKALSTQFNNTPTQSSRPFDMTRDGFVMGEGAGIIVLEDLQHAINRKVPIYAEICGYGLSGDANHITAPKEDGKGAIRCMKAALAKGNIKATDIGYINAHATSTPLGDEIEVRAIKTLFGENAKHLAVSSTKGATGHLLGAAGAVETIFTIMACKTGDIPPTINLNQPSEGLDLNFVAKTSQKWPQRFSKRVALTNSFGFGGCNASLAISEYCPDS